MTEAAVAAVPKIPKPKKAKDPNAKPKNRKPRASTVAVQFAQKIEQAATAKVTAEAGDLRNVIFERATDAGTNLLGRDATTEEVNALVALAVGDGIGLSKIAVAAAKNTLQPVIAEAMLSAAVA